MKTGNVYKLLLQSYCVIVERVDNFLTPINAMLIVCGQAASIKHVKHDMVEARVNGYKKIMQFYSSNFYTSFYK